MNLHDCHIQYFALPETVLTLKTKTSMLAALDIYRSGSISVLDHKRTMYRDRQLYEVKTELIEKGVILESEAGLQLQSLDMEADRSLAKHRLTMPFRFDYCVLTLTALKVLIAIYVEARYSHTAFRIERTNEEIADRAGVALRGVGKALTQLAEHRLLYTKKLWQKATQISLLDPESGTSLFHIGKFYREKLERTPVCLRYASVLYRFDPTGKLTPDSGPMKGCSVNCPFCKSKKKTFRFDSTDDGDHWQCFNCRRSGDSARFYARAGDWPDQGQRLEVIEMLTAACMTPDTAGYDPFASYENYADVVNVASTNAPTKGTECQ